MWVSTCLSMVSCIVGLMLSTVINVPCSAMIVITLVMLYLAALVSSQCNKKHYKRV